ncbi:MAG: AraC family transcriptional regulator [Victivallaceae bacterium]|nr:AraC family transcriptional regulator [Victivallaceae bacterium]
MRHNEFEKDSFISSQIGADISYHSISWNNSPEPVVIPSGGNINYHSLPFSGTLPHSHEFAEVLFILSGRIIHQINGEFQLLKSGNICFVRPADQHCFKPFNREKCEMIILAYRLELFLTLSEYLENDQFLQQFTAPVIPATFLLEGTEFTELCNKMLAINSEMLSPYYKKIKIKIIMAKLFTRFFIDEINLLSESQVPDWLEDLCEKMRYPANFIAGLKKMQHLAGCTKEHLCKSFRKYLNKTPTEFINELRMSHAARQLSDTDEEIFAIAYDLNIQSLSRFYHLFKKYYTVSPAKYRIRAKAGKRIL